MPARFGQQFQERPDRLPLDIGELRHAGATAGQQEKYETEARGIEMSPEHLLTPQVALSCENEESKLRFFWDGESQRREWAY